MNRRPVQPLVDERADVVVCGASFAGLVVARELAGTGADVLVLDRDEIGAHPTSACAAPMPWLEALGLEGSVRQEIPFMRFTTPRDSIRVRLPWSWGAFDYAELCRLLWNQSGGARFERALVKGRVDGGVRTDRGIVRSPLVVDALGWRRVLGSQPLTGAGGTLTRGLEVHPSGSGDALDVVIDRSLVRRGYCWQVPAGDEVRVGAASYDPRVGVKQSTADVAGRFGVPPVRHQGNLIPHRLRPAAENGCFFVGDSAGHCFAFSAEGIRGAFYFGIACGRELRRVLAREATVDEALAAYGTFSAKHRRGFWITYALQRLVPELPPRALTMVIRALHGQRLVDAIFNWYLGLLPLTLAERAAVTELHPRGVAAGVRGRTPAGA
ncbi:MAG: NAD(P)/FAD-dependent oxidoreductase [Actinomycetota bacterium]|nr:NAD(P)/FAD-dependent oxidoreductase [Actinomycetota bacterium]